MYFFRSWKKGAVCLASVLLLLGLFTACGEKTDEKTIKIGASPAPHAEILKEAAKELEAKGYKLEIIEFNDYVQPNMALDSGDIEANFFQHQPYLTKFNEEKGTKIVSVGNVHFEPLAVYAGTKTSLSALGKKDKVAVPNDTTNEARALQLLEANGLIKLKEGAGLTAGKLDIVENPLELEIVEMDAAVIPNTLSEFAVAVVNGNFALGAGLSPDAILVSEDSGSEAAKTFANLVAVKEGFEHSEKIKALMEVLKSEQIRTFIETRYKGAVKPAE